MNKKFIPYAVGGLAAVLLLFAFSGFSKKKSFIKPVECNPEPPCEINCDPGCLCEPPSPTDVSHAKNVHCITGANLAPHLSCGGVRARLEFLYWKANEDGLEYGTKMVAGPLLSGASQTKVNLLDLDFDWNPGFRLGLGYLFNKFDHWGLDLTWTRIRNTASAHNSAQGIESVGIVDTIVSPWVSLGFVLTAGASQANAKWHVNLNVLDLGLGRNFFVSPKLALNPFAGLRGAWVDQNYQAKYNTHFLAGEGVPLPPRNVHFKATNDFRSFGLRGGADLLWHFSSHWNLFAQLSGSLLYGKFDVKISDTNDQGLGEGGISPSPLDFKASEKFWRTRANFEEAIGIGWETFFQHGLYHLSIQAAYEASQWLNQNQIFYSTYFRGADTISFVPNRSIGNLSFQGIKFGIQLDF
jgi:hypothetical protein